MIEDINKFKPKWFEQQPVSHTDSTQEATKNVLECDDIINLYLTELEEVKDVPKYKKLYGMVQTVKDTTQFKELCLNWYTKWIVNIDDLFYYDPTIWK